MHVENELEDAIESGRTGTDLPIVSGIMMLLCNFCMVGRVDIYTPKGESIYFYVNPYRTECM